jgi:hypothetical protein
MLPLHVAAYAGSEEAIIALVPASWKLSDRQEADVYRELLTAHRAATPHGRTVLHYALLGGHAQLAEELILAAGVSRLLQPDKAAAVTRVCPKGWAVPSLPAGHKLGPLLTVDRGSITVRCAAATPWRLSL